VGRYNRIGPSLLGHNKYIKFLLVSYIQPVKLQFSQIFGIFEIFKQVIKGRQKQIYKKSRDNLVKRIAIPSPIGVHVLGASQLRDVGSNDLLS